MANNEWGTPAKYIESARKVMGSIDVDPASNFKAQQVIKAHHYYTKDTPAFGYYWLGNVWLNPPYGRGEAAPFLAYLKQQLEDNNVDQAIVLTNNVPDTIWWRTTAGEICDCICMPDHRIAFINPETGRAERGNDRNQIIVYVGENVDGFVAEFSQYGLCCLPVREDA